MYYNFTGGLQEMAPPVSVTGEPVKVESDTSVEYNAEELATQIVNVHKKVRRKRGRRESTSSKLL